MDINRFFVQYRKARQFLFCGENYIDVCRISKNSLQKIATFNNISIYDLESDDFREIKRELNNIETGIILNSNFFIFNIFEFEKLPFKEQERKALIEWKLKKVFPENLLEYEYYFYKLTKNTVLSILFKKSLKERIEQLCFDNSIDLIYFGNSTVEIINNLHRIKASPDFFIEVDNNLFLIVFRSKSIPIYIRKFRSNNEKETVDELLKTINYVKENYSINPDSYAIISNNAESSFEVIKNEISAFQIEEISLDKNYRFIFPGMR